MSNPPVKRKLKIKPPAALAGVLVSALLVSQAVADLRACEGAYAEGDWATALRECRPAAAQGNASAQFSLGAMYDTGLGVPPDHVDGAKWYRRAAEQGHAEAQFNLGVMYHFGRGVPQDDLLAYFWFNLAASRADTTDRKGFLRVRDFAVTRLTPEQRARGQEMAREWKPKQDLSGGLEPGRRGVTPRSLIEKLWNAAWDLWGRVMRAVRRFVDTPLMDIAGGALVSVYLVVLVLSPWLIREWFRYRRWKKRLQVARAEAERDGLTPCHPDPVTWAVYWRQRR